MKKSHIKLTWNLGFTLHIPAPKTHVPSLASRLLVGACLLSLALGLVPLLALLAP